jgi:hypothetical protein
MYWVSTTNPPRSAGNSSAIGRIIGTPSVWASSAIRPRCGMSDSLRWVKTRATSTALSSNAHGQPRRGLLHGWVTG